MKLSQEQRKCFLQNPKTKSIDPLNLLATNRIKCLNCSQFVPDYQLQSHLSRHCKILTSAAPPSSISLSLERSGPIFHVNHNFNYVEPLDVKTLDAKELPVPQNQKKSISQPKHQQRRSTPSKPIHLMDIKRNPSNKTLSESRITRSKSCLRDSVIPQDYFIEVKLDLHPSKTKVQKRSLFCLRNKSQTIEKDMYVQSQIPNHEFTRMSTAKKNTYQITSLKQSNTDVPNSNLYKSGRSSNVSIVPADRNYLPGESPIRAFSTSKKLGVSKIEPFVIKQQDTLQDLGHLSCYQCGGFYCPHCKSTVHPKFRQPSSSFQHDFSRKVQFSRTHLYKN